MMIRRCFGDARQQTANGLKQWLEVTEE